MYEPQQQINMAAESNVNQISNIDLAEEVTEETPQPVQNHTPEIDEEKRKEMIEEITKVSNYICVGCADTLVVACWTLASQKEEGVFWLCSSGTCQCDRDQIATIT